MAENSPLSRNEVGFDLNALRSVEAVYPSKVLTWDGDWTIKLDSGREVSVRRVYQFSIYAGLLAGVPRDIEPYLQIALTKAKEFAHDWPIVMLEPVLRALRTNDQSVTPSARPQLLPRICTIAELNSSQPARDKDAMFSMLVAVWFSDRLGWPDDEDVLAKLRAIDWDGKAADGDF